MEETRSRGHPKIERGNIDTTHFVRKRFCDTESERKTTEEVKHLASSYISRDTIMDVQTAAEVHIVLLLAKHVAL